jgi:hypothetical protein
MTNRASRPIFSIVAAASFVACAVLLFRWGSWKDGDEHWIYAHESQVRPSLVAQQNIDLTLSTGLRFRYSIERSYLWTNSQLVIPYWVPIVLTAILPTIWFIRFRRHENSAAPLCPVCGYDLRATPERCPECGQKFPLTDRLSLPPST